MSTENFVKFSFNEIICKKNNQGVEKKNMIVSRPWTNITKSDIRKGDLGFAVKTGKVSGITVFDFDDINVYKQFIKEHPELKKCYKVKTFKGYHLYFNYSPLMGTTSVDQLKTLRNVDVRNDGGIVFCPPTQYTMLDGTVGKYEEIEGVFIDVPQYLLDEYDTQSNAKNTKKTVAKKTKVIVDESDESSDESDDEEGEMKNNELIKFLLQIVNNKRADNYNEWLNIGFIIHNELGQDGFKLFDDFSRRSEKYDAKAVKNKWASFKKRKDGLKLGSLKMYARCDNPIEYAKVLHKFNFIEELTTASVSKHFKEMYGDKFMYCDERLYHFNGVYWETETKTMPILNNFIKNDYFDVLLSLFHEYEKNYNTTSRADVDAKRKSIYQLRSHKKREEFIKEIKCDISCKVDFDKNPMLFAFNNKIFNLELNQFVTPNPLDYVSITTGYDYDDDYDCEAGKKTIDKLLKSIFPKKEIRDYCCTILSTGLDGNALEKFIIYSGTGGNGKSLINELMLKMLGNYGYKLSTAVITDTLKTGANPEVANLNNKRYVIVSEPKKTNKINSTTIREITGGSKLSARLCHSNCTDVNLSLTFVLECNNKPLFDEVTDADVRRLMELLFEARFKLKADYDQLDEDEKEKYCVGDPLFKTDKWKDENKQALFELLREYYMGFKQNGIVVPKSCKDSATKHLAKSDTLNVWINDNLEKSDDKKQFIKVKDIYLLYKESEYFSNLTKAEKRELSYKTFSEELEKNIFLGKYCDTDKNKVKILKSFDFKNNEVDEDD